MISLFTFNDPPRPCAYRADETCRMKYEVVGEITPAEYEAKMLAGWRRFGHSLFTHDCRSCSACQSIRVPTATFQMNRSQRRAFKTNADVAVTIHVPEVTREKLDLYDCFHEAQVDRVGWPSRGPKDVEGYYDSFVRQPFRVEEWQYRIEGRLVGVGYVDPLPQGLSAIYFFHEPEERGRSLGTFNVLKVIESAQLRKLPYVHLGYFVEGCRSLEYKGRFVPNEVRSASGLWSPLPRFGGEGQG